MMSELSLSAGAGLSELLHSGAGLPAVMTRDIFLGKQAIVGSRYLGGAEEIMGDLKPGERVTLLHETDNRFDGQAVIVIDAKGRKLGYLPRAQNMVVCALLDAGKYFYGLVKEQPGRYSEEENAPFRFFVDLYMREYTRPEDLTRIPRHGEGASYAAAALFFAPSGGLCGLAAVKVINGEERGYFERMPGGEASREELREMCRAFDEFTGYLPLVSHGIGGEPLRKLEEAYGVLLGKPFSNHVIDTEKMVRVHLPDLADSSLSACAAELGLEPAAVNGADFLAVNGADVPAVNGADVPAEDGADAPAGDGGDAGAEPEPETVCRLTWKLYRRLERSETERRQRDRVRMLPLENLQLSVRTYLCLRRAGMVLLGDIMDRSEEDMTHVRNLGRKSLNEVLGVMAKYGVSLAEEDFALSRVVFRPDKSVEAARDQSLQTLLRLESAEELQRIKSLPEDERTEMVNREVDRDLALVRAQRGDVRDTEIAVLFLGSFTGYTGDFSPAAFAALDGTDGLNQVRENGCLMLALFYNRWHAGKMREETNASMLKVCARLAECVLLRDILGSVDEETRTGAAGTLFKEALTYVKYAAERPDTAETLISIGRTCMRGVYESRDGRSVSAEKDDETAYRAFYFAAERGAAGAEEMKHEVLRAAGIET